MHHTSSNSRSSPVVAIALPDLVVAFYSFHHQPSERATEVRTSVCHSVLCHPSGSGSSEAAVVRMFTKSKDSDNGLMMSLQGRIKGQRLLTDLFQKKKSVFLALPRCGSKCSAQTCSSTRLCSSHSVLWLSIRTPPPLFFFTEDAP